MLALLLLHPNRVVSRDRLIDELWDGSPPETASTALQVHVSQLRKALGRDAIVTQSPGYLVRVEPGALDLERFDQLLKDAQGQDAETAAATLREALELWRAPPLADVDDSVARGERAQLEERRASALERRVEADLELGLHTELIPELEALVREDPLRERRRAQLMLALYRSGRQADALDAYRSGRKLLAEELGLEPGGELRQLEKAILEHDPALAPKARLQGSEPITVQPHGVRRYRVVALIGAVLLVGAIAGIIVSITGGSDAVVVVPNSVAVVSAKSGRVVDDVPIGGRPVAIAVGAGAVWVANADDGTIVRIDPRTKKIVKTIGLGVDVNELAFGFGSVWVAGGNSGTLTRIDPKENTAQAPLELGGNDKLVPQAVFLVAIGAGHVWVTRGNELLRIDPETNEVQPWLHVPRPTGLTVGNGSAWVTLENEHVLRVDATTGRVTADQDLSEQAYFPLLYGGSLWLVALAEDAHVSRLDPNTVAPQAEIQVVDRVLSDLASGRRELWTVDPYTGVVWRIDPATNRAKPFARVHRGSVALAATEAALWVAVQGELLR